MSCNGEAGYSSTRERRTATSKQEVKKGTIIGGRARDEESETKNTVPMFAISFRNGHAAFFIFVPNTALNPECKPTCTILSSSKRAKNRASCQR